MWLYRLLFVIAFLGSAFSLVSGQDPIKEDDRLTFVRGLLVQIMSRALSDRQATAADIAKVYEDRLASVPEERTDPKTTKSRRFGYELLVKAIVDLTRRGVTADVMFKGVRLAKPEEVRITSEVVVWLFPIPATLKTDQPTVKAIQWTLLLFDQNKLDHKEGLPPNWKLLGVDKALLTSLPPPGGFFCALETFSSNTSWVG